MQLRVSPQKIRRIVLEQAFRAHVGHIGSSLSVCDIIAALYSSVLNIPSPDDPDRDRFVLSKGHAALALYAALSLRGWITEEELNSYCTDDTLFGVHPEHRVNGIDFCSGSLGQGITFAAGASLAAKMQHSKRRVFALLSDAECDEGSVWEAVMFAAQHQLSNLVAIIDLNGQQALGYTRDVLNLSPMSKRWNAFGWDVHEVDGHNTDEMIRVISDLDFVNGPPHVLIAHTIFGKGVSYMQSKIKWHYWPMSESEYLLALQEQENNL